MNIKTELNDIDRQLLLTYASCDMKLKRTAETLNYGQSSVTLRMRTIKRLTGLNPHKFWQLCKLLDEYCGGIVDLTANSVSDLSTDDDNVENSAKGHGKGIPKDMDFVQKDTAEDKARRAENARAIAADNREAQRMGLHYGDYKAGRPPRKAYSRPECTPLVVKI